MGLFEDDSVVRAKKVKQPKKVQAVTIPIDGVNFTDVDLEKLSERQVASGIITPKINYVSDE